MKKLFFLLFFISSSLLTTSISPIRAQCIYSEDHKQNFEKLLALGGYFKKEGLIFVDSNPDVILCAELNKKILIQKKPIIILERWSSATLTTQCIKALNNKFVVGVFKNRIFRDPDFNAFFQCRMRYHFYLINCYASLGIPQKPPYIDTKYFKKIYCVPWDFHTSNFSKKIQQLAKQKINFAHKRPIDVFFAGNTYHPPTSVETNKWYTWHRKKAIEVIKSMSGVHSVVLEGRPLPFDEYVNLIKSSKIVVSPWGLGEWCFKDAEAMLLGAVLVKPDTSFVKTIPDIFNENSNYIACKPDFSDLQQHIGKILNDYEKFLPMRIRAKKRLSDVSFKKLAKIFVDSVADALGK